MHKVVLTVAMILVSGSAIAGSIEHIRGDRTCNDSVIAIRCEFCLAVSTPSMEVAAPQLVPGTQDVSIREIGGRRQTVRTEAWLGGSPVTYVSTNPMWLPAADAAAAMAEQRPAPVDEGAMTSALGGKNENEAAR